MATGSQNMTTYIAKQVIGDITNADWSGALLHSGKDGKSNSIDTWIFADDYGSASSNYGIKHNQTEDTIEFVGASTARTTIHLGKSEIVVSHLVGGADTWYTARTLTIGNTGKSVDGSANVSWSKDEILGGSTNAYFLRGDKVWSDTLNGVFTANGNITANGGMLKSTANGNTVTIGSQNTSFTHIYNSASIPFIFNNTVETTSGNLGTTTYPWNNIYIGKADGAGIYYVGSKNTYRMIRFIDNTGDIYGNGISIGGGGYTVIGSGESADTMVANRGYTGGSEVMIVASDGTIQFFPDNNSYDASAQLTMSASRFWAGVNGNTAREAQVGVQSGAGQLYMWSHASTTGDRGIYTPAHGSGSARAIFSVNTNNRIFFADSYNGTATALAYSQAGLAGSAISWLTCWNGYELRAISKAEVFNVVRDNGGDSRWVNVTGDTMSGDLLFANSGTTTRQIRGIVGDNDYWRVAGGATASNAGWMEIATADDGNEPIYVRQYTGVFTTLKRTLTLLDANGHTALPGNLTMSGGVITLWGERYNGNYGLNCNNSDIINVNSIRMADNAETYGEGLMFKNGSSGWDCMAASGGTFYFRMGTDGTPTLSNANSTANLRCNLVNSWHFDAVSSLNANDVRTTNGIWACAAAITNAAMTNHSVLFGASNVGTPFQIQIPDSSHLYIYKRWYRSSAWSGWSKISAGYADSAGSVAWGNVSSKPATATRWPAWTEVTSNPGIYANDVTTYGNVKVTTAKGGYYGITFGTSKNCMTAMSTGEHNGLYVENKRWIFYHQVSNDHIVIGDSGHASGWLINLAGNTYCYGAFYSGDNRGGQLRMTSNWLGFYSSANAGGTRYGYIQTDSARMHFVKENSSSDTFQFDFNGAVYISGMLNTGGIRARGGLMAQSDHGSGNCAIWFTNVGNSTGYWKINIESNDRMSFQHYDSGTLKNKFWINTDGTTGSASSRKIKHNIQSINFDTGYIIDRMQPVSYIVNGDLNNKTTYGFIYEDLVQVLPDVCDNQGDTVGITYTAIIPVLTKEIQNLRKRLAAVETELNYYRSKI